MAGDGYGICRNNNRTQGPTRGSRGPIKIEYGEKCRMLSRTYRWPTGASQKNDTMSSTRSPRVEQKMRTHPYSCISSPKNRPGVYSKTMMTRVSGESLRSRSDTGVPKVESSTLPPTHYNAVNEFLMKTFHEGAHKSS
jgi:hypothetical protein